MASIYVMLGQHSRVKNIIERDIRQLSDCQDSTIKAKSLYVLAQSCAHTDKWLDAKVHIQKAIELLQTHNPTFKALGRYYHSFAVIRQHYNERKEANELFELALRTSKSNGDTVGEIFAHVAFIENLYEMGMNDLALERVEIANRALLSMTVSHEYNGKLLSCYNALCNNDHIELIECVDELRNSNYQRNNFRTWYTRIARIAHNNRDYETSKKYFELALVT
jgi:tetratricopeptide (TPR) repeat protein